MPLLGGVRPPVAAFIALLLAVSGLTLLGLGSVHDDQVPQAAQDAEQQIAADAALSVRISVTAEAATLRHAAEAYPVTRTTTATAALTALLAPRHAVLGGALLDPRTGRLLAARGESVPVTGADATALAGTGDSTAAIPPRLVSSGTGARLLYFARLTLPAQGQDANADQSQDQSAQQNRHWLLAVSERPPAAPVHGTGRTAWLLDRDGDVLDTTVGTAQAAPDTTLLRGASGAAQASGWHSDASGSLLGGASGTGRTVAGWAAVATPDGKGDTSGLQLTVLTAQSVPPAASGTDYTQSGFLAAAALAGIALLGGLLLVFTVQRPVLRLHLSATRLARGAAEGDPRFAEDLARPVPVPGFGEPRRIARALESLRRQLRGEHGPEEQPAGRGPGTRALALVCLLLVAGWSVPLIFVLNQVTTSASVPASVLAAQQARTESAADRVRQSLDQSYTDLSDVAASLAGRTAAEQQQALRRTLTDHTQYRSLYLLDRTGAITLRVGKQPLRTLVHVPAGSGITNVNTSGRIPAIAAYAGIPAAKGTARTAGGAVVLFGEIDVNALNTLLSRPGLGSVWLTDTRDRVLAAGVGFRAFQALPAAGLSRLADRTAGRPGAPGAAASTVLTSSTGMSVAAAAPLAQTGAAAALGWRVVTSERTEALRLTAFSAERRTMLAGLLGLTVGTACLGWLNIVVLRPLRALAGLAERLAGGDRRTLLYPVNHDETGSVTRNLELIRQALVEQGRNAPPVSVPARPAGHEHAPQW